MLVPTFKHYGTCPSTKVIKLVKFYTTLVGFEPRIFLLGRLYTFRILRMFFAKHTTKYKTLTIHFSHYTNFVFYNATKK